MRVTDVRLGEDQCQPAALSRLTERVRTKSERCATLGRSQDVCKGSRFTVEGERCVASGWSLLNRLGFNDEEEEAGCSHQKGTNA